MGELASHERYANFYTDFAFKKNLYKLNSLIARQLFRRLFSSASLNKLRLPISPWKKDVTIAKA